MTVIAKRPPPHRSTRYVVAVGGYGCATKTLREAKRFVDRVNDKARGWCLHPIIVGVGGTTYVGYVRDDWRGYIWEVRRAK